jgi:hypothetical protein
MRNLHRKTWAAIPLMGMGLAWGQPAAPTTAEIPCGDPNDAFRNQQVNDTVVSVMDKDGYLSLMDGSTIKGWWQSCATGHSTDKSKGGIFKVSPENKAFYLASRNGSGGILMTNKKFTNYEIVFDMWSDYGNDGGIFHRTPASGVCVQTVLDYVQDAAVGGIWGEGGINPGRDIRPWAYDGSETNLKNVSGWTTTTSKLNPTSYGCPATGCVMADYLRLWDADGWNQLKLAFYGGTAANSTMNIKSWFRKLGSETWVPILMDTAQYRLSSAYPAGYIGLQIHNGNRWSGAKGFWYRDIKWRELDEAGKYTWSAPVSIDPSRPSNVRSFSATERMLRGTIESDFAIVVTDLQGRVVESFNGKAGSFEFPLRTSATGILTAAIHTSSGTELRKIFRSALR